MGWWPENLTDWVLIISGIATTALLFFVWRQFAISKKDVSTRLRPWIAPIDVKADNVIFRDGSVEEYDKYMDDVASGKSIPLPKSVGMSISLKNAGTIPGTNVTYRFRKQSKQFSKENLKDYGITDIGILLPGEYDQYLFDISYN